MDVSAISGYSTTISLINALSPTSQLTATSRLGGVLSLASAQTSISNLGYLLNASEALAASATALSPPGALAARTASFSNAPVATATADATTPTGAYSVQVNQLARAQTLTTASQASSLAAIGSGQATTLTFQFASGVSRTVSLGDGNNTLAGIASAINGAGIGIQAQVANTAGGYQLSLTGQTGAANAFTISVSGNTALSDLLAYPSGGGNPTLTSQAQDAQGLVNGVAFTASTNSVNTAVPGLTLNLAGVGNTTLDIGINTGQTKAVSDFIGAYNAVQTGLAGLSRQSPNLALSAFFLQGQLAGALNTGGQSGSTSTLAQIGITANADGTLSLDAQKFQAALSANPDSVGRIFSNGGKGVAEQVAALTSESLSPSKLLQVAAPIVSSPANLALSFQSSLFSSLFEQQGSAGDLNGSANLANQFLLAELSNAGSLGNAQNDNSLLDLLSRSQSFSQSLATLGSRLSLAGLL